MTESGEIGLDLSMLKRKPQEKTFQPLRIERDSPIEIKLDRFFMKKIPVVANLDLQAKPGFIQVGTLMLSPDSITVSGPEILVDPIQSISTVPNIYPNLIRDLNERVSLIDSLPAGVTISHHEVEFSVDIQRIGERSISGIMVKVEYVPSSVSVQIVPSTLTLKLQGGVDILKNIEAGDITASIDYRTRRRYSGRRIPAMIAVPDEVTFSDVKPKDFELLIER
jgi:YbbR domain-containing protein